MSDTLTKATVVDAVASGFTRIKSKAKKCKKIWHFIYLGFHLLLVEVGYSQLYHYRLIFGFLSLYPKFSNSKISAYLTSSTKS
jgi:hypothetical protein